MSVTLSQALYGTGVYGTAEFGQFNVTINTGVGATGSIGSLAIGNSVTLSGVAGTGAIEPVAAGGFEVDISERLDSVSATASLGTVVATTDRTISIGGVDGELNPLRPFSASGDAQLSTAESKFGTASLLLDGTGDFVKTDYNSTFLDESFTVEFWIYTSNYLQDAHLWDGQVSNSGLAIAITSLGKIRIIQDNVILGTYNSGLGNDAWHHIALTGSTNLLTIYVDGASRGQANVLGGYGSYPNQAYRIGSRHNDTQFFDGYIDEFRTSYNVRYVGTFTPPSSALTVDANTEALIHFDGTNGSTTIENETSNVINLVTSGTANVTLGSVSGTAEIGDVEPKVDENLNSVSATGSIGSLTLHTTAGLSGVVGTFSVGAPTVTGVVTVFTASAYDRKHVVSVVPEALQFRSVPTGAADDFSRKRVVTVLPQQTSSQRRAA